MSFILQPWQFLLVILAGWVNEQQQQVIDYLRTENQLLKEKRGKKRILLSDDQRRRLAVDGRRSVDRVFAGRSSNLFCGLPRRTRLGATIASKGPWPSLDTTSRIKPSARFSSSMGSNQRLTGNGRPHGRHRYKFLGIPRAGRRIPSLPTHRNAFPTVPPAENHRFWMPKNQTSKDQDVRFRFLTARPPGVPEAGGRSSSRCVAGAD
jgi:hypothetical protein